MWHEAAQNPRIMTKICQMRNAQLFSRLENKSRDQIFLMTALPSLQWHCRESRIISQQKLSGIETYKTCCRYRLLLIEITFYTLQRANGPFWHKTKNYIAPLKIWKHVKMRKGKKQPLVKWYSILCHFKKRPLEMIFTTKIFIKFMQCAKIYAFTL